ncbi:excinuclease ABC subunit UvrB [Patescibacteria group bacterium]
MSKFKLVSKFTPQGHQKNAISGLTQGLSDGLMHQTLLGVTGSGKTFTMAGVIEKVQRPTLVIAHNKTLAAQLAAEFAEFFPENAVQYFVSYYDYYQPESYIPRTDTYIEKETDINDEIEKLRHAATMSLLTRKDVIIVASVSCIYGLGTPSVYEKIKVSLKTGEKFKRNDILKRLVAINYARNDFDFKRSTFRVRGDVIEVYPSYEDNVIKVSLFGDEIEKITKINGLTGEVIETMKETAIYPASHYATERENVDRALEMMRVDLKDEVAAFERQGKLVEAQRLEQRTKYDIEMLEETGFVSGIENYSRYINDMKPGEPPFVLLDYFPKDFLMFIDESHKTVSQIDAMNKGDAARKRNLVDYGFRLKAAYDNRPLKFSEFLKRTGQTIYVSATPGEYETSKSDQIVEQIVRPTGLLDPSIEVKKTENQIDDLMEQIQERVSRSQRVLVTTMTKKMSEELTTFLKEAGVKVQYLHSDIETFERLEILRDLRLGKYDVVVGINLLREGLDLPEVSLITILDADKESFLRDKTSLIQIIGRAARHVDGHVIMYADKMTKSMRGAIEETDRRRGIQEAYNKKHGITPKTIQKAIRDDRLTGGAKEEDEVDVFAVPNEDIPRAMAELEDKMQIAADNLQFEDAAKYRDELDALKERKRKKKSHRGR